MIRHNYGGAQEKFIFFKLETNCFDWEKKSRIFLIVNIMFCGLRLFCCFSGGSFKVGVHVNLKGILRGLKKGQKKENYFWTDS